MSRPRHPHKDIERAVRHAESLGWRVFMSQGHAWGHLLCPLTTRDGCRVSVWSTPRNPENHARQIQREIDLCPHGPDDSETEQEGEDDDDGA